MAPGRDGQPPSNEKKDKFDEIWSSISDSAGDFTRSLVGLPMFMNRSSPFSMDNTDLPTVFAEPTFFSSSFALFHLNKDVGFPQCVRNLQTRPLSVFDFFSSRWTGVDPRIGPGLAIRWPPRDVDGYGMWPFQYDISLRGNWTLASVPTTGMLFVRGQYFDEQVNRPLGIFEEMDKVTASAFNHPFFTQRAPSIDDLDRNFENALNTFHDLYQRAASSDSSNTPFETRSTSKTVTTHITRTADGTFHKETVTSEQLADGSTKTSRTVETTPVESTTSDYSATADFSHKFVSRVEEHVGRANQDEERRPNSLSFNATDNGGRDVHKVEITKSHHSDKGKDQGESTWSWFWSRR